MKNTIQLHPFRREFALWRVTQTFTIVAIVLSIPLRLRADLSLETETARMLAIGQMEYSAAAEYQHSKEGGEYALPLAFEIGLHPRLSLLIEPTPVVWISHKNSPSIHGVGDTEITGTYLLRDEIGSMPAFALAGEVKLPTAHNRSIGTGQTDYALYLVASKRFGQTEVHANVAYTLVGKPAGTTVQDTSSFAIAVDQPLGQSDDFFAEAMYTTSALAGGSETSGVTAEIGVDELIGTLGMRHHFSKNMNAFASISFDNANATLFRLGATCRF